MFTSFKRLELCPPYSLTIQFLLPHGTTSSSTRLLSLLLARFSLAAFSNKFPRTNERTQKRPSYPMCLSLKRQRLLLVVIPHGDSTSHSRVIVVFDCAFQRQHQTRNASPLWSLSDILLSKCKMGNARVGSLPGVGPEA